MSQVVLEEVTKTFRGTPAVEGVSLSVSEAEFFTLLGPSGCGKTTTLRLVAGLEFADRGRVMIRGRDVTRTPPARRRIAMVFQNYALYPHMTIAENIGYPLKLRRMGASAMEEKVKSVAETLKIHNILSRRPYEISGGQQQRAAVARAMVRDPLVYLFDEPLSNLDARLRLESRRFLKRVLHDTGGTAIYVTHDQTEAMALSDRVGVMRDGKLVQTAPPEELYLRPASTFVASFVGNLPMNLVEGTMEKTDAGTVFVSRGLRFPLACPEGSEPGRALTVGIRPEDILLGATGDVRGTVENIETLGSEMIVTVDCRGSHIYVRLISDSPPSAGDVVALRLPQEKLHLFDEKGRRL